MAASGLATPVDAEVKWAVLSPHPHPGGQLPGPQGQGPWSWSPPVVRGAIRLFVDAIAAGAPASAKVMATRKAVTTEMVRVGDDRPWAVFGGRPAVGVLEIFILFLPVDIGTWQALPVSARISVAVVSAGGNIFAESAFRRCSAGQDYFT